MGRGIQRAFCSKQWCCPQRLNGAYCHVLLQQALPHLGGRTPNLNHQSGPHGRTRGEGPEGRRGQEPLSLLALSSQGGERYRGVLHRTTTESWAKLAHQSYMQMGDLNVLYLASHIPHLFPCRAGCARLSPAETQF